MNTFIITKIIRVILVSLALMMSTACSAEPSNDILKWAIIQKHAGIEAGAVKMENYDITNHYTRKINDETIYVYDYTATTTSKLYTGQQIIKGNFSLVKRGDKWYMYQ